MEHIAVESPIKIPKKLGGNPEITLAPLVDVVFLLLIFFMVTTVFPDNQGLAIEKPRSSQTNQLEKASIMFVIDKTGAVYLEDKIISIDDIPRLIQEDFATRGQASILLLADQQTMTQHLITVMDAVQLGGVSRIGIATKPDHAK